MGKLFNGLPFLKKWWFWTLPVVGTLFIGMSVREHISDEVKPAVKETHVAKAHPKSAKKVAEKPAQKKTSAVKPKADEVKADDESASTEKTVDTSAVSSTDTSSDDVSSAPVTPAVPAVPSDFYQALEDARSYSSLLHMSRQGIYNQLVSEYGEGHSAAAAQYAIDNLQADYNYNALQSARTYQEMGMTPEEIREQLVSSYGEGFTESEANYAVSYL